MNWPAIIEREYQIFLGNGGANDVWTKWPVEMYDQLVADGAIDEKHYTRAIPVLLERKYNQLFRTLRGDQKKMEKTCKQIEETKIEMGGNHKPETILLAKQYCVLKYFERSKEKFLSHVYQPQ